MLVDGTERFSNTARPTTPDSRAFRVGILGSTPFGTVGSAVYETGGFTAAPAPLAVTKFSNAYARGWTSLAAL